MGALTRESITMAQKDITKTHRSEEHIAYGTEKR